MVLSSELHLDYEIRELDLTSCGSRGLRSQSRRCNDINYISHLIGQRSAWRRAISLTGGQCGTGQNSWSCSKITFCSKCVAVRAKVRIWTIDASKLRLTKLPSYTPLMNFGCSNSSLHTPYCLISHERFHTCYHAATNLVSFSTYNTQ